MTPAGPVLLLRDGIAEAAVRPDLGGGLAAYDLIAGGDRRSLFRPAGSEPADAFALACNPLVPWSNRISGGGFRFDGRFHVLSANWPGESCPLHGNGFLARWHVAAHREHAVELTLESSGPGPFLYTASLRYWLEEGALGMELSVLHRGADPLPYGLGFHPWFVRTATTSLQAAASRVWLEDARHLPDRLVPVHERPGWDFKHLRRLPESWINNGFVGWDGSARVTWPERRLALAIEAHPLDEGCSPLSTYVLYSPGGQADFFCFEPVSHPVDAHNLPDAPGLFVLGPSDSARVQCLFTPVEM